MELVFLKRIFWIFGYLMWFNFLLNCKLGLELGLIKVNVNIGIKVELFENKVVFVY